MFMFAMSENKFYFSDAFKGYGKGAVVRDRLK